jgi:ribonuclease HI
MLFLTGGAFAGTWGTAGWAAMLRFKRDAQTKGMSNALLGDCLKLVALREGLKTMSRPSRVVVVTDSRMLIGWLRDGWRRNDAAPAALVQEIERIVHAGRHRLRFQYLPGPRRKSDDQALLRRQAPACRLDFYSVARLADTDPTAGPP